MTNREYLVDFMKKQIETLTDAELLARYDEILAGVSVIGSTSQHEVIDPEIVHVCDVCPVRASGKDCPETFCDKRVADWFDAEVWYRT